jgi:AcrR family transcriptional regulator
MPPPLRKVPAPDPAADPPADSPHGDAASANEQRILRHALHSFATRGYAATGLRAIAADARLTAPMVNYYFKTKEALYQRVGAFVMDGLVAAVVAACPDDSTLVQTLTGNLLGHLAFGVAHPEAVRFLFGLLYGPEEGRPGFDMTGYAAVEARIRQRFERAFRSGSFTLHPGVTRADAFELYQGLVMSLVMHDAKAPKFGKPVTEPRVASRRLGILLAGLGTLHA